MQNEDKRDFDAAAASWDEEPRRVKLAREIADALRREVPLSGKMEVLDYGCGSGLVTLGIQPFVRHITGADSSRGMLDVLEGKVRGLGLTNVATRLIDLEEQKRFAASFDLVISSMTLHHVQDTATLIAEFARILNPGGWLALADLEAEDGTFHDNPAGVHHHGFEREYLCNLFMESGLSDVRVVTAASVIKETHDGGSRTYPVILAVGRKPGLAVP